MRGELTARVAKASQLVPPQAEKFMAKGMGVTVVTVPASHPSLFSRRKEVVDLIIAAGDSFKIGGSIVTKRRRTL